MAPPMVTANEEEGQGHNYDRRNDSRLGAGDNYGNTTLDEVAMYNRALPAAAVSAHYQAARTT